MGDSRRLQIADAVKTRLESATVTVNAVVRTKPSGLTVERYRLRSVPVSGLPRQIVYFQNETTPERNATGTLDWDLRIAVASLAEVPDSSTPADDTVDPLVNWAMLALFSEETLGGLADFIEVEGTAWDAEEREERVVRATTVFRIHYRTKDNDPEAAP